MEEAVERAELLAARHYLYATFARVFGREPDEALAEALEGDLFAQACDIVLGAAGSGAPAQARGSLAALAQAARSLSRDEYTRLFIGPGALVSPPWESVHRTGSRSLFQEGTLQVREAYAAFGFRVRDVGRVADDHLATELAFMAALCAEALAKVEAGDAAEVDALLRGQAAFLQDHLRSWVGAFARQLSEDPRAGGYACAARALEGFLCADASALEACAGYSMA